MDRAMKFLLLCAALLLFNVPARCESARDYFQSGMTNKAMENWTNAIADFSKAIELKPDFAEAYISVARQSIRRVICPARFRTTTSQ